MGRRCNISLFGGSSQSCGISLFGSASPSTTLDSYSQEYVDLKKFILNHFMKPLIKKDMDIINLNSFNFIYLIKKLEKFSHMFDDASIFLKLISAIKSAIEITNENQKLHELVYGKLKDTTLFFRTTAVEFVPEIQIYIQLYGKPLELSQFDQHRLYEIKRILKNNNNNVITFQEIKEKLGSDIIEVDKKKKVKIKNGNIKIEI